MKIHQRTLEEQIELGRKCRRLLKEDGMTYTILARRFGMRTRDSIRGWVAKADEADKLGGDK